MSKLYRPTLGAARFWVGDFIEALTCETTTAEGLVADGSRVWCPDVQFDRATFGEVKAVGNSNQIVIYEDRLKKDKEHIENPCLWTSEAFPKLLYLFWRHKTNVKQCSTLYELRESLASTTFSLTIADLATVWELLSVRECRIVNSAIMKRSGKVNGYGALEKGYGVGWTLSVSDVQKRCSSMQVKEMVARVYDHDVKIPVEIRCSNEALERVVNW